MASLMAAQVSASMPIGVCWSPRSPRMRASTGNAVIDIDTPMNSANDANGTPAGASDSNSTNASAPPSANGTTMLACEMTIVIDDARAQHAEVELEADQEHVEDDADLRDDAEERRRVGGQQERGRFGRQPPEQRRAEDDAADHLADHRRLVQPGEQQPDEPRGDHDHRQGQQDFDAAFSCHIISL